MERLPVRSYRRVFDIDRRVYRVDRWELPVPGGVPLKGLGYWGVAMIATVTALLTPVVGDIIGVFGALPTIVLLPVGVAYVCTRVAPDGRKTERFALGWLMFRSRHRRYAGEREVPKEGDAVQIKGKVRTLWCQDSHVLRKGRVTGPATVRFHEGVDLGLTHRGKWRTRRDGIVRVHDLPAGETLQVKP